MHDWQIRYNEGLKKCGKEACLIEYPNAFHSFYGLFVNGGSEGFHREIN